MATNIKGVGHMMFIERSDIDWKEVGYLRQGETFNYDYTLTLNEPLASWDVWDYWERERIESMKQHLNKGDVLFDIGTESGWCNLVYAEIVGPENMVLIEPTPEFWPNIHALWYKRFSVDPRGCYAGLMSDTTTDIRKGSELNSWGEKYLGPIVDRNKYIYIHDNSEQIPMITIDEYVSQTGIVPDAITIDVEGAEFLVFKGGENTLKNNNLKLFVSIHDDLGIRDYNTTPEQTIGFLESLGYRGEFLAKNHEAHWYFTK
jgi:FkbM family methyltransferase